MQKTVRPSVGKDTGVQVRSYRGGIFRCRWKEPGNVQEWMARWTLIRYRTDGKLSAEMEVEGRSGTCTVLFGEYRDDEHYICIPDLDVGCPLSYNVQDISWNAERLGHHMNKIDAATIAHAIADFARKTGWERFGRPCPQSELMDRLYPEEGRRRKAGPSQNGGGGTIG